MENNYETVRLMKLIESIGENETRKLLSDFSCEYKTGHCNEATEKFLKLDAINFSKQKLSITYLMIEEDLTPLGYFTLTHKPIAIETSLQISKTQRKKIQKYSFYDKKLRLQA